MNLESQLRAVARRTLVRGDALRVAAVAGWHPVTLSNWLAGKRRVKDVAKLEALAAALGVRLAVVIEDAGGQP